ncbi:hypothetical protein BRADI_3g04162v3 [Brachypodium distachyon]|uniref:Uncharacterized protein n=1 Tax=Brachypodium distachyon TaxID=15368 RepID=A0A2K2CV54_BRADI|nr:hypothetical protein BRADI_3g04162v3 [Brachypodium distachyon]
MDLAERLMPELLPSFSLMAFSAAAAYIQPSPPFSGIDPSKVFSEVDPPRSRLPSLRSTIRRSLFLLLQRQRGTSPCRGPRWSRRPGGSN